jgi:hypothetical protein
MIIAKGAEPLLVLSAVLVDTSMDQQPGFVGIAAQH